MQDTLDRQIVQQALLNPNMGKFRGGGDEVGAALANFINAREDARARAIRNEKLRQMDREEATRLQNANGGYNVEGAGGQTNWGSIFNPSNQTSAEAAYAEQAPTNVMYSGRTGNGNIDYSFPARQGKEPNDYTFQNAMPTEQNGFHLGDYPQTEMYGDPKDWQRQMVRNAAGLNGDSKWFNPSAFGGAINNAENSGQTEPTLKFTGRTNDAVWKPYQQALTNNPQTPQGQKAIDTFNNQFFDKNVNPSSPAVDSPSTQATDGNNINSVGTTKAYYGKDPNVSDYDARVRDLANAKYLDKQYSDYDQWSRFVNDNGVTDSSLRHVLYEDRIQPLIEKARQERLRESYRIANDPNVDENTRTQALAALAYDLKKPTLVDDVAWAKEAHQIARDNARATNNYRNAQANSLLSSGSGFVDRVRDLQGKIGYRAADGTNCMRTLGIALQGTPYEGQTNVDQAVNTAKQYGDLHAPGDGYRPRPGDIAVVNNGNHAVMLTENGGTIQNGESHNGVYEDPRSPEEMFGGVKYWISSSRYAGGGRRGRSSGRTASYGNAIDKQALKAQQNFEKNTVGMRKSAMNLAGLQNISPDDEKGIEKYEKGMDDFTKQIEGLYDSYGLSGNKMDSTRLGIALYHELNETRSGLRPETLAEGVARAIYAKRGDVSPEDLQKSILAEVYSNNGGGEQGNQQTTTTKSPEDRTLEEAENRRMDRLVNGDLSNDNSEGVLVTSDGRKFTDSQLNARDMFLKERHLNPQYKSGSTWWNGVFSI